MREAIHPAWHETPVRCMTCGTTWTTGSTVDSLTVEICSNCHPFYTGEQRIVDTEGRVDKFMKRLQQRDEIRTTLEKEEEERTPLDLPITPNWASARAMPTSWWIMASISSAMSWTAWATKTMKTAFSPFRASGAKS